MAEPVDARADPGSLPGFGFDEGDSWMGRALASEAPLAPGAIGPYEIVEIVGRGAQGIVYRARRRDTGEAFALKRLLGGPAVSPTVRARFEREFDAEAGLSHPNIVGVHRREVIDGQPLLAMEWIDGVPVDRWARGEGPSGASAGDESISPHAERGGTQAPSRSDPPERSVEERLRVFLKICKAVEHAHQRGVIHRDLKPSNILVDASGEPRVLDFGLAKLVDADGADRARLTQSEGFVGTLVYAAPEQLRPGRDGVDTRTDVYALGVLLYQLLTGRLPHDPAGDLAAIVEAIQRAEPVRPSAMVPGLDRDLDAIVAKAMAKEKDRRYPTVDALAADVRRQAAGEPVEARHRSMVYILRKAARRHRVPVAIAAGYVLLTTSGLAVALALWREATNERAEAESVVAFLHDAIGTGRPGAGHPRDYTVREMLDAFSERLGDGLPGQPEAEATLRDVLGTTYQSLGESNAAWEHIDRALALRRGALGPGHRDTRHTQLHWAFLSEDRGDYAEAERAAREVVEASRRGSGEDVHNLHEGLWILGGLLRERGALDEAERAAEELVEVVRRCHGEEGADFARAAARMGDVLEARGRLDEADRWFTRALELWRRGRGDSHVETAMHAAMLARLRVKQGRAVEAEALLRPAVAACRASFDEDHPTLARVLSALGTALSAQGRDDEAGDVDAEVLRIYRAVYGDDHPRTAYAMHNLGSTRRVQRRFREAEELLGQAVRVRRQALGPDHPALAASLEGLAVMLWSQRRAADAEPLLQEALRINTLVYGERSRKVAVNLLNLGAQAKALKRPTDAEATYRRALEIARAVYPADHPELAEYLGNLGGLLRDSGDPVGAERMLREAHSIVAARFGDQSPQAAYFEVALAGALRVAVRLDEAERSARHAVEALRPHAGHRGLDLLSALEILGDALEDERKLEECLPVRVETLGMARAVLGGDDPRLANALMRLGRLQLALGLSRDAESALRECLAIREHALPAGDWARSNAKSVLGGALAAQGAALRDSDPDRTAALLAEAEPLLLDGYAGMKDRSEALPVRVQESLERIVALYDAWGRPEKAAEYRALLDAPATPP